MKRLITLFQRELGLAASEAIVVIAIISILLVGWVGRTFAPTSTTHDVVAVERVIQLLDTMQAAIQDQAPHRASESAWSTTEHRSQPTSGSAVFTDPEDSATAPSRQSTHASYSTVQLRVHLNTASRQVLMRLPGVGPATADKIIAERTTRPFVSVDDLTRVKGIGVKKLEKLRSYVMVP